MAKTPSSLLTPGPTSRRDFLRRTGVGLGVAASAMAFQACDADEPEVPAEGTLQGFLTDPDGNPIAGVRIMIAGTSFTTTTDANGFYRFTDVPAGTYTVNADGVDVFDAQTAEVNIVRGGTGYTQNFNYGNTLPVVTFDFSNDFGILNYAYALEQLEAAFYERIVEGSEFDGLYSDDEKTVLRDLAAHEGIHRDFLKAAISGAGGTPIPDLLPAFLAADFETTGAAGARFSFSDRDEVLATAQVFEDLGVAAYNGAGKYIRDDTYLLIAGKIVSVEARHASVISGIIAENTIAGEGVINARGLDRALEPSAVLTAADPFIFNTISASNVGAA